MVCSLIARLIGNYQIDLINVNEGMEQLSFSTVTTNAKTVTQQKRDELQQM